MIREFPSFSCHVYKRPPKYEQNVGGRGDIDEYTAHAYQYATSSMPGELQPAAIVYAANEEDVLLAEAHLPAGRGPRGERHHLVGRKVALGQDVEHLAADRAGRADHRHLVAHEVRFPLLAGWRVNALR